MYRRNIRHILIPLAIAFMLLVAYHLIIKPSIPEDSLSVDSIAPAVMDRASEGFEGPPPQLPLSEVRSTRAVEYTSMPQTEQAGLLEAIRDDIETGNLTSAEARLNTLPAPLSSDMTAKPYVAILWNNLGLQQERLDGTVASIKAFKKASALYPENPTIQLNLAHAYWAHRDRALNADFLTKLITLAPDEPFPHLALADLLYEEDKLHEAATHLTDATERIKNNPGLRSYLEMVTAKVRRADTLESGMMARSNTHFMVKFDGEEDPGTWTSVLGILEEAYRDIGQRVDHYPSKPIIVVLHTQDRFQDATGSPAWADGLFDSALGRIQIPTQGAMTDVKWLTDVLRHEYVHALLHDRVGAGAVPTWLNEGLATQLAGNSWPDLDQVMQGEIQVIPLQYLEGSWMKLPQNAAMLAYVEANSATRFLIDRWGMARVDELLTAFKARQSVATALQSTLFVSYEQFHSRWLDTFQKHT